MKTYIIVRRDLKMRRGKEIAQACHAALGLGLPDCPIVTLQVPDLDALACAVLEADLSGCATHVVRDAGKTEVEPGTITCAAIHAPDGFFSYLGLY